MAMLNYQRVILWYISSISQYIMVCIYQQHSIIMVYYGIYHQRHLYPIIIPSGNDSDDTWRTIGWKSQNAHLV
jgi:hypothetical protein